ncbi:MAG TPA: hypothetical protein PLQ34_07840 [Ferrovaceae bacterium]|jgi:hypothetical protein|nr:hypothetical protein [Ferrovaceae bacterium]
MNNQLIELTNAFQRGYELGFNDERKEALSIYDAIRDANIKQAFGLGVDLGLNECYGAAE